MEKVVAKFQCNAVIPFGEDTKIAHLDAVYGTEGENADFASATPSGHLQIMIDKSTPAVDYFKQGKKYYLTFEEAPE